MLHIGYLGSLTFVGRKCSPPPIHEESGWGGPKWKGRELAWNKLIEKKKKRSEENRLKRIEGALTVNKDRPQTRGEFFFPYLFETKKRPKRKRGGTSGFSGAACYRSKATPWRPPMPSPHCAATGRGADRSPASPAQRAGGSRREESTGRQKS